MRKIHMVDGALRLNFPMNLLLNHFKARKTVFPGSSDSIPDISRLITVSATTRSKEYKNFRDDGEEGVQIQENLGRAVDVVLNQIGNASRTSVEMIHGAALSSISHIDPVIEVHSGYVVDPGLIRISMDYGRMRAYDILDLYPDLHAGGSPLPELAESMALFQMMSLELAILRKKAWSLEQTIVLSIRDNRPRYYDILAEMPLIEDISVDLNTGKGKRLAKIWKRSQKLMDRRRRRFRDPRRDAEFGAKTVGENIELWKKVKSDIICLENLRKNVLPGGAPVSRAPSGSEFEEHQAEIGAVLKPLMFYGFWPVVG